MLKVGQIVLNDLTGRESEIVSIETRDRSSESIPGVRLLGNYIKLKDNETGEVDFVYDWEVTEL